MNTLIFIRVFLLGIKDGFQSPDELSMGMTYPTKNLNETYDRGVNVGQALGKLKRFV